MLIAYNIPYGIICLVMLAVIALIAVICLLCHRTRHIQSITVPIKISWDKQMQQALISINLQENQILTMSLSKENLITLSKDINDIIAWINGDSKISNADVLKAIPNELTPPSNDEKIVITGQLYKLLSTAYRQNHKLTKENRLLNEQIKSLQKK